MISRLYLVLNAILMGAVFLAFTPRAQATFLTGRSSYWTRTSVSGIYVRKDNVPYPSFVSPNEQSPYEMAPVVRGAPEGLYVAVGTERGLIGGALTPNVDRILMVDRDPRVFFYSQINIALLSLAKNRKDYLELRHASNAGVWARVVRESKRGRLTLLQRKLLLSPHWHEWFGRQLSPAFEMPPPSIDKIRRWEDLHQKKARYAFQNANYLYSDELFSRLHRMVLAGRVDSIELNLGDELKVATLVDELSRQNIRLSVFDISNAWSKTFMPLLAMEGLLHSLERVASNDAIFMGTDPFPVRSNPLRSWKDMRFHPDDPGYSPTAGGAGASMRNWLYMGVTFESLRNSRRSVNEMFSAISKKKFDEINLDAIDFSRFDESLSVLLPSCEQVLVDRRAYDSGFAKNTNAQLGSPIGR